MTCSWEEAYTPEDVTMAWVKNKFPDLKIPDVIRATTHDRRTILFMTKMPGQTLGSAWPTLTLGQKVYYVNEIAQICATLAEVE